MKILIGHIVFLICFSANATKVSCYQDPRTDALQCIDETAVRQTNGVRSTALYTGGPNNVRKTSYTINVNCKTEVTHLKDRDGVSFAGGYGNETEAILDLRQKVCAAKVRK